MPSDFPLLLMLCALGLYLLLIASRLSQINEAIRLHTKEHEKACAKRTTE